MKKSLALLVALCLLFACVACGAPPAPAANSPAPADPASTPAEAGLDKDNPIYIGLLDAMTGDRAMSGMYAKEGAEMFVEYINANGGVLGRELVVVYEDDQGNETVATNAFQKITSEYDLSAVVLNKFSSVVLAMEEFLKDEGIPGIACGSSVKIADSENPYLYSTRKSDYGAGESVANACANLLGMTKVAILHAPDALGTGMSPVVERVLAEQGVEVVSVQQFSADEKNFAPYIAKMINSGCDGIVAIAQQTEAALIMSAVADAGLDIPCIGSSAFCQQTAINNAGEACNGWYSVTSWSPTVTEEPAAGWVAAYEAKYGHAPDMSSVLSYDALAIFAWAIEACGSDDPAAINAQMEKLSDFQGLAATYSFTPGTQMLADTEFLTVIENMESIVVEIIKG
jgi:ABC-type branched-chain amino acid transport systems, periplasmic component